MVYINMQIINLLINNKNILASQCSGVTLLFQRVDLLIFLVHDIFWCLTAFLQGFPFLLQGLLILVCQASIIFGQFLVYFRNALLVTVDLFLFGIDFLQTAFGPGILIRA